MIRQSKSAILQFFAPAKTTSIDAMRQKFEAHKHAATSELDEIERLTHRLCETDSRDSETIFFAYDGDYNIQHVSDQVPQLLGYQSEELLGTSILDYITAIEPGSDCSIEGLINGNDFSDNDIKMATKEGESVWVRLSGFLVKDAQQHLRKGIIFGVLL